MTCMHSTAGRHEAPVYTKAEIEARFRTAWLRHAARLVHAWIQRRRQRDALSELDAHLLDDIGVSRQEAQAEAEKPFWRK